MAIIYWTPGAAAPYPIYPPLRAAIGIGDLPNNNQGTALFQASALAALDELAQLPNGLALINSIIARLGWALGNGYQWGMTIRAATNGANQCYGINAGGPPNPGPRTTLVSSVIDNQSAGLPGLITAAMGARNIPPPNGYQVLADEMNNCPTYRFVGLPAWAPSNFGITAAHVQNWATVAGAFPAPFDAPGTVAAITNALFITLRQGMVASGGIPANVMWDPNNTTSAGALRPAYIGLAHEMIHARNYLYGIQLGSELDTNVPVSTTVLYEYMCVGLGPWAGQFAGGNAANPGMVAGTPLITENMIRLDANWALRDRYA